MAKRLTKRQTKLLLSVIVALVLLGLGWLQKQPQFQPYLQETLSEVSPGHYRVTDFADGDTITVDMDGKQEKIRMIGVDTPETHHPEKPVQCFGEAASAFTKNLIGNQGVRLEADPTNQNRDRYNRLLRYVYLPDGRLVNAEIIKEGYGFAYTSFPFVHMEEFKRYEQIAKEQSKGLWNTCQPLIENGNLRSNDAAR